MMTQDIIRKKRDGLELSAQEINEFVQGIEDWSIADGQISALLMAFLINGMSKDEITEWVRAVADTGMIFNWKTVDLDGPVAAIHCTPSVGDKIEIIACAVLAANGLYLPMICDRMQYHTGGTMDKLDSIRGYDARPTHTRFRKALRETGCAFMTSTEQFAPADMRIQSIRDITATLDSLPLMIASTLIKKVSAGIHSLTIDVKVGSGSFTNTQERAAAYIDLFQKCLPAFEIDANITSTEVDHVIGQNVGNGLEIYEVWAYLTGSLGQRDSEIHAQVKRVTSAALVHNKICDTIEQAEQQVERTILSGLAAEQFGRMLTEMGVSPAFMSSPHSFLDTASVVKPVYPDHAGTVESMNLRWIGLSVVEMGAGRMYQEQKIDFSAGYTNMCKPGMYVSSQIPLAFVHAHDEATAEIAVKHLKGAIQISE